MTICLTFVAWVFESLFSVIPTGYRQLNDSWDSVLEQLETDMQRGEVAEVVTVQLSLGVASGSDQEQPQS